jgi:hypothetical protein
MDYPQNSELIRFGFLAKKPKLISSVMKMSYPINAMDMPWLFHGAMEKPS